MAIKSSCDFEPGPLGYIAAMPIHVYEPDGGAPPLLPTNKYALFDLDGTLVVSMTGRLFASRWLDCLVRPGAESIIRRLRESGYNVFIVSNQAMVQQSVADKMQQAARHFGVSVYAAVGKNCVERKPAPHMWQSYTHRHGITKPPDKLLYCGDAAGATASGGFQAYEWADSDYQFAQTIHAKFLLPQQLMPPPHITVDISALQVVLLMGTPGAGKTEFAKYFAAKVHRLASGQSRPWVVIEQDKCGSKKKAHEQLHQALIGGNSAVIDATHPSRARRVEVLQIAQLYYAAMRIIWLPQSGREANKRRPKPVPSVAYNMYGKNFDDPRQDGLQVDIVM